MRFRGRGVEQAEAGVETAIAKEKRGNKTDEEYAKAAAVRKEGRATERKRQEARKRLVLFCLMAILSADAQRFEAALKQAVPKFFESQPDLLFQRVTLLPRDRLKKAGVNV